LVGELQADGKMMAGSRESQVADRGVRFRLGVVGEAGKMMRCGERTLLAGGVLRASHALIRSRVGEPGGVSSPASASACGGLAACAGEPGLLKLDVRTGRATSAAGGFVIRSVALDSDGVRRGGVGVEELSRLAADGVSASSSCESWNARATSCEGERPPSCCHGRLLVRGGVTYDEAVLGRAPGLPPLLCFMGMRTRSGLSGRRRSCGRTGTGGTPSCEARGSSGGGVPGREPGRRLLVSELLLARSD